MVTARFGREYSKGIVCTAVAVAAMASLSASQAPSLASAQSHHRTVGPPPDVPIDGGSPYVPALPPPPTPPAGSTTHRSTSPGSAVTGIAGGAPGIPATVFTAYKRAEAALRVARPGCHLPWQLLAAIGQVESAQADGGAVDGQGTTLRPILGPVLDGSSGDARISAVPTSYFDGNSPYQRAVGPMQFIPSTWATWGADGNGDGVKDPDNVFDAALAAGDYLCAVGGDLSVADNMSTAVLGYNPSQSYLRTVLAWYRYFRRGTPVVIPDGSGTTSPNTSSPSASKPASRPGGRGAPGQAPSSPAGQQPATQPGGGTASSPASGRPQPHAGGGGTHIPLPSTSPWPSVGASSTPSPSDTSTTSPAPTPTGGGSPSAPPTPTASPSPSTS